MHMNRRIGRIGLTILCGATGLLLHAIPALSRLWLGRIATLPIAVLYGPWYGAAAAMPGAAPLFHQMPIAPIVFAIEAIVIGEFARRRTSPVFAGAVVSVLWCLTVALFPATFKLAATQPGLAPAVL